jgi:hypothetical protein
VPQHDAQRGDDRKNPGFSSDVSQAGPPAALLSLQPVELRIDAFQGLQ